MRALLTSALWIGLAAVASAQQFALDLGVLPATAVWTDGVVIADLDGDGDNDIVFANGSGYATNGGALAQHYYQNDGAGNFTSVDALLNVANFNAKQVIAEDFDGDGDLDLMFAQMSVYPGPSKRPVLLINQGGDQAGTEGVFADVSATNLPATTMASFGLCAGDVDNDGDLDVVLTDGGTFSGVASQAKLFRNDGSASFTDVTAARLPADLYNAQDVTLFDFDLDWDVDIALAGKGATGKRGRLYRNKGDGQFIIDTAMDAVGTQNTYEADWGDLDGDGDWDAAVQSISGTSEGAARNDGPGVAMPEATFPAPNGDDDNELGMLDYDMDGDLDVFVGSLGSREKAYRNNGNSTFTNVNSILTAQGDSTLDIAFGDLDGDDRYDLVTAQGESGAMRNKAYMNSGAADTLAPVVVRKRNPSAISDAGAVYLIDVADAISEDGHVNATVDYAWTTTGAGAGSGGGTASRMGGGLYRAEVPTVAGTTSVSLDWTVTDDAGNVTTDLGNLVTAKCWVDIGSSHPGVTGNPVMSGTGKLLGGTPGLVTVSNAAPSSFGALFVAVGHTPVPFYGGTLEAFPFLLLIVIPTDGTGSISLPWASWPPGLPGGFQFWFQYAVEDAAAVGGFALTNALEVTAP